MVGILENIIFSEVSFGGECNLFHHGIVQDCLQKKDFEFSCGNLYGIIGEFGDGGAALSCGITGNTNFYEGKIFFDNIEKKIKDVIEISWYIGNDLYQNSMKRKFNIKPKINKKTIKEQIEHGVQSQLTGDDCHSISQMFQISSERLNRNISFVSGERWKASAAIGYANGKKIFCYPWMNSKDIERYKEQLVHTVNILLDTKCIIIIPTTKEENVKSISNNAYSIYLNN
ncbi:hypothetical protein SAMN02910289_01155 [Lachnospiraceae bacterium RM5]|nr:hypothetical protein SAMN02910289_01155 [Lachnospiraceae bacterium RM5]